MLSTVLSFAALLLFLVLLSMSLFKVMKLTSHVKAQNKKSHRGHNKTISPSNPFKLLVTTLTKNR